MLVYLEAHRTGLGFGSRAAIARCAGLSEQRYIQKKDQKCFMLEKHVGQRRLLWLTQAHLYCPWPLPLQLRHGSGEANCPDALSC